MSAEQGQGQVRRYLTLLEVAQRCGVTRGALYKRADLLRPDVVVGTQRGWDPVRVDEWWSAVNHTPGPRRQTEI